MTARTDPLPLGSSPDNADRDPVRAVREAKLELDRQLAAGEISQTDYDSMISVMA